MKKIITSLIIVAVVLLVVLSGCKARKIPSGAYDAEPTATPQNVIDIKIFNIDGNSNVVPVPGLEVRLYYPNNNDRYEFGITGDDGKANIIVHDSGTFRVDIEPNTYGAYSNVVSDSVNIKNDYTYKEIICDNPTVFVITPTSTPNYGYTGGTYLLGIKSGSFSTPRYVSLTITATNATSEILYSFVDSNSNPKDYLLNQNETVYLKVSIPQFYQNPSNALSFLIKAKDQISTSNYLNYTYIISQSWHFDMYLDTQDALNRPMLWALPLVTAGPTYNWVTYPPYNPNMRYMIVFKNTSTNMNVLLFDTLNFPTSNTTTIDIDKIEYKVSSTWYDSTMFGGVPRVFRGIPDSPAWTGTLVHMPFILPAGEPLKEFYIQMDYLMDHFFEQARVTFKVTNGGMIYYKTFTTI